MAVLRVLHQLRFLRELHETWAKQAPSLTTKVVADVYGGDSKSLDEKRQACLNIAKSDVSNRKDTE